MFRALPVISSSHKGLCESSYSQDALSYSSQLSIELHFVNVQILLMIFFAIHRLLVHWPFRLACLFFFFLMPEHLSLTIQYTKSHGD